MKVLILIGTTCSGKTDIAYHIAKKLDAEIIFADSMKVYKWMNIGTAKPPDNYRRDVNFHLIDIIEPFEREGFNASKFAKMCIEKVEEILGRKKVSLIVCGTPMYLYILLKGHFSGATRDIAFRRDMTMIAFKKGSELLYDKLKYIDPEYASRIHRNDAKRIIRALEVFHITGETMTNLQKKNTNRLPYPYIILGIRRTREDIYDRINRRVDRMIEAGLVEETEKLLSEWQWSFQATQAIGYRQLVDYLQGKMQLSDAIRLIKKKTRQLARRQMLWFKSFEVDWIDVKKDENLEDVASRFISKYKEFLKG